jgi:exosortase/archaeosortase family protein
MADVAPAAADLGGMMASLITSALVLLATWESWQWYVRRIRATPEDILALIVTVAVLAVAAARADRRAPRASLPLSTLTLLLTGYAASRGVMPPLVRAGLALGMVLFCLNLTIFRQRPPVALWGLAALALPVLPSLHFVLGYPLRIASATLAVVLISAHGLAVERQGTFLIWQGAMVDFDAPCSGVNMLWAGLLFTLMGCALLKLGAGPTAIAAACCVLLAVAGNVLRTTSLFYLEAGLIGRPPAWWHEGIGLVAFALSTMLMLGMLVRMVRRPV